MSKTIRDKVDLVKRRLKSFAEDFGLTVDFIEGDLIFGSFAVPLYIDCYLPYKVDQFHERYKVIVGKNFEVDKVLNKLFYIITAKLKYVSEEELPFIMDEDSMEVLDMLSEKYRRDRNDILLDALKWYAHVLTVAECALVDEEG